MEHRDGRRYPHDADNSAEIYEDKHGHLWVTHQELLDCGYINLADFDVVYLNGKFYELQAYMRKPNAWWIEEVQETAENIAETPQGAQGESA